MSQLTPYRGLLMNLRGEIPENRRREYLPRERALELLRQWTGQDFGLDADRWESWLRANVEEFRNADS
jgi:hypothetical protein